VSKKSKNEVVSADGDGAGGRSVPGAIAGALISPLVGAPRNVGAALEDLRTIAETMQVLPQVLESLRRIENHVSSLDEEVMIMRRAVESMGTKLDDLSGNIEHLGDGIKDVGAHVDRLEPHLIEMKASLQPFKRWTGRVNRNAGAARAEAMDEKAGD
jgi:chromosome segregation ATPase